MSRQQTSTYSGGAVGLTLFASVLMIMIGVFQSIAGVVALINDEFYVLGQEWVFQFDISTWGWIHLTLGVVIALAGVGVLSGAVWARTVGVVLAVVSAVVNFAWLPWYPIWGIIMIALPVAIIWALTAHGRDITAR
ncbi:MAG: hypothetical protein WCA82_13995 [Jiangellales bacterium]